MPMRWTSKSRAALVSGAAEPLPPPNAAASSEPARAARAGPPQRHVPGVVEQAQLAGQALVLVDRGRRPAAEPSRSATRQLTPWSSASRIPRSRAAATSYRRSQALLGVRGAPERDVPRSSARERPPPSGGRREPRRSAPRRVAGLAYRPRSPAARAAGAQRGPRAIVRQRLLKHARRSSRRARRDGQAGHPECGARRAARRRRGPGGGGSLAEAAVGSGVAARVLGVAQGEQDLGRSGSPTSRSPASALEELRCVLVCERRSPARPRAGRTRGPGSVYQRASVEQVPRGKQPESPACASSTRPSAGAAAPGGCAKPGQHGLRMSAWAKSPGLAPPSTSPAVPPGRGRRRRILARVHAAATSASPKSSPLAANRTASPASSGRRAVAEATIVPRRPYSLVPSAPA